MPKPRQFEFARVNLRYFGGSLDQAAFNGLLQLVLGRAEFGAQFG